MPPPGGRMPPRRPAPPVEAGPLECLPLAYLLGMPKCGSSDLWERLARHPQVLKADRKEVRYLTRGEFSEAAPKERGFLPPELALSDFTQHHAAAARQIWEDYEAVERPDQAQPEDYEQANASPHAAKIIVDGGPHTLWWSIQDPDGQAPRPVRVTGDSSGTGELVAPAPIPQILRGLQPRAKLVVTLAEPVRRMYSDYFFLHANSVAMDGEGKSPEDFHQVATQQVKAMHRCFLTHAQDESLTPSDLESRLPYLAEQACAYDRYHFGRPGTGRIAIGLYHAFLRRWLQLYPRSQLLVLRLEDFNQNPRKHLAGLFEWLGLEAQQLDEGAWQEIVAEITPASEVLVDRTFNEHRSSRAAILPESEALLRKFYEPFNARLAKLLEPGGAAGLMRGVDTGSGAKPSGGGSGGSGGGAGEGDPGAARFTWEDVWLTHSATKAVMRSAWSHEEPLGAHDMHDPELHKGAPPAERRAAAPEEPKPRALRGGDPPRAPPPPAVVEAPRTGRDNLLKMPEDMVAQNGGANALCLAAMGLHLEAVDKFLNTSGVSTLAAMANDRQRTALHCLGHIWIYGDSLKETYIFSLLQDTKHWLDQVVTSPAPVRGGSSYGMWHVTHGARHVIKEVAKKLLERGADPNALDEDGKAPLHYAALGGLNTMVEELLKHGADPNVAENVNGMTPLHCAGTHGHANVAKLLLGKGADPDLRDSHGNSFREMAVGAGSAIPPADLEAELGWKKEAPRVLGGADAMRKLHGTGGWSEQSLPAPLGGNSLRCDADMLNASLVAPKEVYKRYIMMNRPVLLRGINADNPGWEAYHPEALKKSHSDLKVRVSDIPYNEKFGSHNGKSDTLGAYIDQMAKHSLEGGDHPWYVFIGSPVPKVSDKADSLVHPNTCPIPRYMYDVFSDVVTTKGIGHKQPGGPPSKQPGSPFFEEREEGGPTRPFAVAPEDAAPQSAASGTKDTRSPFVNMQWALGTAGSGAPVHFHNTAWNQLFYGKKHWYLFPPGRNLMGKKQVLDWVENDLPGLEVQGFKPFECHQQPGDVLIVPELWGHAVLNTQDALAVASEFRGSSFRLPIPHAYRDLSAGMGNSNPDSLAAARHQDRRQLKKPVPGGGGSPRGPPPGSPGVGPGRGASRGFEERRHRLHEREDPREAPPRREAMWEEDPRNLGGLPPHRETMGHQPRRPHHESLAERGDARHRRKAPRG